MSEVNIVSRESLDINSPMKI